VDSLPYDPFYVAINGEFADNEASRRQALGHYFDYRMNEGARMGRLVVWSDESVGAAVWLLPAETSRDDAEAKVKARAEFLAEVLGAAGGDAYRRIIDSMRPRCVGRGGRVSLVLIHCRFDAFGFRAKVSAGASGNRSSLRPTKRAAPVIWRHSTIEIRAFTLLPAAWVRSRSVTGPEAA
jgi:hypothetical protein